MKKKFYANLKWGSVAEQPSNSADLPEELGKARDLYNKDPEGNIDAVINHLNPYVKGLFLSSNIQNFEELFANDSELDFIDTRIVGVDFSAGPIPLIKAEGYFEIKVASNFGEINLEEWQNANAPLTDGVSFIWNIERNESTEELDFTIGEHQGVECHPAA